MVAPGGAPGRVTYVSYDGLLEPLGAAQVVPHLGGLAARGFSMSVLSFEKDRDLEDRDQVADFREGLSELGVEWTPLRYHRRPTLPATAYDIGMAVRHLRRLRPRLVHARSYVAATMASLGTSPEECSLLFDMRGLWIDERIEGQGWDPNGLKVRQGRRVERALLGRADHVVHLTNAGREVVKRMIHPAAVPHSTIPTCVDLDRFTVPEDRSVVRAGLGLPARGPLLIHSGTLAGRYQVGRTLELGRRFVKRSGGTFVILTRDIETVSRRAAELGVPALIRSVPPADMPTWIAAADVGLALVAPGPAGVASAPTKVGEYLACGLGVVTTRVGDLSAQLGGARFSRTIDDEDEVEDVVDWLLSGHSPKAREAESRGLAERFYGLEGALDRYGAIYRELGVRPCS